jgi:hypothetical protein
MMISNLLKTFLKNTSKKVISKTSLMNKFNEHELK